MESAERPHGVPWNLGTKRQCPVEADNARGIATVAAEQCQAFETLWFHETPQPAFLRRTPS